MLNAIIFDCFDVLYPDYADNYIDRHPELFKNGLNFRDKLFRQIDLGEISQAQLYESLENITGSPAEEIKTEMESELKPDLNLISLIKRLKTKYKIGLISNA
jgi:FMN phosphatase YigB (HAD superfamily)